MKIPRPARILIVDSNRDIRHLIALQIKKMHGLEAEEIADATNAVAAVQSRPVDIVIFSGSTWEDGVHLYAMVLDYQGEACQFIMFMNDPSLLPGEFRGYFKVVAQPDFKVLLQAVDWSELSRK